MLLSLYPTEPPSHHVFWCVVIALPVMPHRLLKAQCQQGAQTWPCPSSHFILELPLNPPGEVAFQCMCTYLTHFSRSGTFVLLVRPTPMWMATAPFSTTVSYKILFLSG